MPTSSRPASEPSPERLRIARAMLGASRAQLATHVGVRLPECGEGTRQDRPTRSLGDLARAFHAVLRWYAAQADAGSRPFSGTATGGTLDALMRRYVALRSAHDARAATSLRHAVTAARPARRRALLIDDSSDVLVTVGAFLESFDFKLIQATNADRGLATLASGPPVDLLVTDHAMPGLTGLELATEASRRYPALRTLIITGYPDLAELGALPRGVMILRKPFRRAELSQRIRTMFHQGAPITGSAKAEV